MKSRLFDLRPSPWVFVLPFVAVTAAFSPTASPVQARAAEPADNPNQRSSIKHYDESLLSTHTPDVLSRIQRGDASWEEMVPPKVAEIIKGKKLFAVCDKVMAVIDIPTLKVSASPATCAGPDAAGFDSGLGLAFASCGDGTLSIVKAVNGKYETVDTVKTERGARTMTLDEKTHKLFLLAAEYGEAGLQPISQY